MSKKRVDVLLVEQNLAPTREKAKRLIMAGLVFSKEIRIDKPGMRIDEESPLKVKGRDIPYVGRGGLKLEKALSFFSIDMRNRVMIDVGSSTGGFTDCALQNGAKKCYAVDVGYNQLDWRLRNDDRVVVMERTNFRHVDPSMFEKAYPDMATIDVSFISLRLIFPVLKSLLQNGSDIIALVKPQFEAGRHQVGKKGIVRDKKVHMDVIKQTIDFAVKEGYHIIGLTFSPITGGQGNIEFLLHLGWKDNLYEETLVDDACVYHVVEEAHESLKKHQ